MKLLNRKMSHCNKFSNSISKVKTFRGKNLKYLNNVNVGACMKRFNTDYA